MTVRSAHSGCSSGNHCRDELLPGHRDLALVQRCEAGRDHARAGMHVRAKIIHLERLDQDALRQCRGRRAGPVREANDATISAAQANRQLRRPPRRRNGQPEVNAADVIQDPLYGVLLHRLRNARRMREIGRRERCDLLGQGGASDQCVLPHTEQRSKSNAAAVIV